MASEVNHTEFSFPVPKAPHAVLHGHITLLEGCVMVHLTTTDISDTAGTQASMGSFVYAMPDRINERNALSTTLCSSGSSIDYATRLAKILARKLRLPVYVGCSMSFAGVSADEEMEGLAKVVETISEICLHKNPTAT